MAMESELDTSTIESAIAAILPGTWAKDPGPRAVSESHVLRFRGKDVATTTLRDVRAALGTHLNLSAQQLEMHKEQIGRLVVAWMSKQAAPVARRPRKRRRAVRRAASEAPGA